MNTKIDIYNPIFIHDQVSVLEALEQMDQIDRKLLIVLKGDQFHSVLSIGDIQRAIIKKVPLESPIFVIKKHSGNVGVFPIAENSWQDRGNWDDYNKILKIK